MDFRKAKLQLEPARMQEIAQKIYAEYEKL